MFFETSRNTLLPSLKTIAAIVERKQTLPILGNVLIHVRENNDISLTATDTEIEVTHLLRVDASEPGSITLPALKFFDICRSLSDNAPISLKLDEAQTRAQIKSGRGRFSLTTLPVEEFPASETFEPELEFELSQGMLKTLLVRTQFAMAQQDMRYYLNGMLLDMTSDGKLNLVATDGHRLALAREEFDLAREQAMQVILPRKTVLELSRLLNDGEDPIKVGMAGNSIQFQLPGFTMRSKLIDGRFPDYYNVIPANLENTLHIDTQLFKQALNRAAILSDERYKGVRLSLSPAKLLINVHNSEQEEAEEELDADYEGESLEIGFNAQYLMDALSAVDTSEVTLRFMDSNSSCLIQPKGDDTVKYVIMPMRL